MKHFSTKNGQLLQHSSHKRETNSTHQLSQFSQAALRLGREEFILPSSDCANALFPVFFPHGIQLVS